MIALNRLSLKQRRRAARTWSQWRRAGEPDTITAARAYELSGVAWYADRAPNLPVRLTAVAITYIAEKGGRL